MNGIADLFRLSEVEAGKPSPMMLFPIGEWTSAKYPKLSLTQELADELIANFEGDVLRRKVPVDTNHDPKSPANGWHERLYVAPFEWGEISGDALYADWVPNERGAQLVNDGEYAYDSIDIGPHKDPVTGTVYANVLKATTLSNRPVLSMMPGVLDAGDALKLSEPLEIQLSEVTPAGAEDDPVVSLLGDLEAVLDKAGATLKGKPGVRAIRTYLREARSKASAHKLAGDSYNELCDALEHAVGEATGDRCWVCDFGVQDQWVIYEDSSLDEPPHLYKAPYERTEAGITLGDPVEVKRETTYVPVSDGAPGAASLSSSQAVATGKAGEGAGAALAEDPAAQKGVDPHMKTVIAALNLSEDADEATVLAAVKDLIDGKQVAETKLAETEKAKRTGEVEVELAEIEAAGNLKAGEKAEFVHLAEEKPEVYAARLADRKALKPNTIVDLGTRGSGSEGDRNATKRADVELYELTTVKMAELQCDYAKAASLVLSENKGGIADRYREFSEGREG